MKMSRLMIAMLVATATHVSCAGAACSAMLKLRLRSVAVGRAAPTKAYLPVEAPWIVAQPVVAGTPACTDAEADPIPPPPWPPDKDLFRLLALAEGPQVPAPPAVAGTTAPVAFSNKCTTFVNDRRFRPPDVLPHREPSPDDPCSRLNNWWWSSCWWFSEAWWPPPPRERRGLLGDPKTACCSSTQCRFIEVQDEGERPKRRLSMPTSPEEPKYSTLKSSYEKAILNAESAKASAKKARKASAEASHDFGKLMKQQELPKEAGSGIRWLTPRARKSFEVKKEVKKVTKRKAKSAPTLPVKLPTKEDQATGPQVTPFTKVDVRVCLPRKLTEWRRSVLARVCGIRCGDDYGSVFWFSVQ